MVMNNDNHTFDISFVYDFNPDLIRLDFGHYGPIFSEWFPMENLEAQFSGALIHLKFQPEKANGGNPNNLFFADKLEGSIKISDIHKDNLKKYSTDNIYPTFDFCKSVVKNIIEPTMKSIIDTLILKYHQFWITEFSEWNSRKESLSQYCYKINMQWRIDNGESRLFSPSGTNYTSQSFQLDHDLNQKYIMKSDWKDIQEDLDNKVSYGIASQLLTRAHSYSEVGDIRISFIEGISALEITLDEFIRLKSELYPYLTDHIQHFYNLNNKQKISYLKAFSNILDNMNIEKIFKCIDIRNKIVHDGYTPNSNEKQSLLDLFMAVSNIIGNVSHKFPSYPIS